MKSLIILAIIIASFSMQGDNLIFHLDKDNIDLIDGVAIDYDILGDMTNVCDDKKCWLEIMFVK